MITYIEAFNSNNQQILGNLDGQTIINSNNYKQHPLYKKLITSSRFTLSLNGKVTKYHITNQKGTILEIIKKY